MSQTVLIILGALAALVVILGGCLIASIRDKKKLEAEIKRLEQMFVFIEKEQQIHKESKDNAENKIADLHDGDSVHNAIAELSKRKGASAAH